MKSIEFPNMFNSNSTRLITDLDATKQNTLLLLRSEKGELVDDPYFGIRLKKYLFEQNNLILKDILIDEIYTQLALFMPQLKFTRKNIKIVQDRGKLYCRVKAKNQATFQLEEYSLVLYNENE